MTEPTHEEICKERIARLEGHITGLHVVCAELIRDRPDQARWGQTLIRLKKEATSANLIEIDNLHPIDPLDRQQHDSGLSAALTFIAGWFRRTVVR